MSAYVTSWSSWYPFHSIYSPKERSTGNCRPQNCFLFSSQTYFVFWNINHMFTCWFTSSWNKRVTLQKHNLWKLMFITKKTVFVKCINLTSKFKLTCSCAQQNTMCNKLHKDFILSYTVQQKVLKNILHHEQVLILSCPPVVTVRSHYCISVWRRSKSQCTL